MKFFKLISFFYILISLLFLSSCGRQEGSTLSSKSKSISGKIIYGEDDREDIYMSSDNLMKSISRSTLSLIKDQNLEKVGPDYKVVGRKLKNRAKLCTEERFGEQVSVGRCSGFLVTSNLIVTAGHCAKSMERYCQGNKWVFGYSLDENGELPLIKGKDIYSCVEIVDKVYNKKGIDYAVLRLDREVKDRLPLKVRTQGTISKNVKVASIGNPVGLPTKIISNGLVRSNNRNELFVANTDSFAGGSGSVVVDQETGLVEGIIVRGGVDYKRNYIRGCRIVNKVSENSGRGEDIVRITEVTFLMNYLKENK